MMFELSYIRMKFFRTLFPCCTRMTLARAALRFNPVIRSLSTSSILCDANPNNARDWADLMPAKGKVAAKKPVKVQLKAGQTYAWCACGWSLEQPWCDGKHAFPGRNPHYLRPVKYTPTKDETVVLCTCKQTNNRPFCDGSHKALKPGPVDEDWDEKTILVTYYQSSVNEGVAAKLGFKPDIKHGRPFTFVDDHRLPEGPADNMPDFVRKKTW